MPLHLRLRKKKKEKTTPDLEGIRLILTQELGGYMSREEFERTIQRIRKHEKTKRLWDSLSAQKKIELLRYVKAKRGGQDGKK